MLHFVCELAGLSPAVSRCEGGFASLVKCKDGQRNIFGVVFTDQMGAVSGIEFEGPNKLQPDRKPGQVWIVKTSNPYSGPIEGGEFQVVCDPQEVDLSGVSLEGTKP